MLRLVKIKLIRQYFDHHGNDLSGKEYYGVIRASDCHIDIGTDWLLTVSSDAFEIIEEVNNKETRSSESSGLVQSLGAKPNKITIDF